MGIPWVAFTLVGAVGGILLFMRGGSRGDRAAFRRGGGACKTAVTGPVAGGTHRRRLKPTS